MFYVQLFISNTYYTICKFLCLLYTWYSFQGFTKGQKVARSHLTKLCTFLPFAYICLYCVVCCQWFCSFHKHKNKNLSMYISLQKFCAFRGRSSTRATGTELNQEDDMRLSTQSWYISSLNYIFLILNENSNILHLLHNKITFSVSIVN